MESLAHKGIEFPFEDVAMDRSQSKEKIKVRQMIVNEIKLFKLQQQQQQQKQLLRQQQKQQIEKSPPLPSAENPAKKTGANTATTTASAANAANGDHFANGLPDDSTSTSTMQPLTPADTPVAMLTPSDSTTKRKRMDTDEL